MDQYQSEIARIALSAADAFGFVLAGGNALSLHGIGRRPTEDVDLFTSDVRPDRFAQALSAIERALHEAGWLTQMRSPWGTYARITAERDGRTVTIDLGVDYRSRPPSIMDVGPVLSLQDAAASKMATLYSRAYPRDFLDVAALVESGRFTQAQLLTLGDSVEASPMDRPRLIEQLRLIERTDDDRFEPYGVSSEALADVRALFQDWAASIAADVALPESSSHLRIAPVPDDEPGLGHGMEQ